LSSPDAKRRAPVVLCAGIAVEDFLFKVDSFPAPGTKAPARELVAFPGGCAANTDDASRRFVNKLGQEGVDLSGVHAVAGGSISVSGIFIDGAGEKMVATLHGRGLDGIAPPDPQRLVADIDILMVDNRFPDFVLPICRAAAQRGVRVVLDVDKATRADHPLFDTASHVICSSEALLATTGLTDIGAALMRIAPSVRGFLAVTNGPDDVLWIDRGRLQRMKVFKVDVVDTLGAGDSFHGAFALALAEGRDEISAMRFAAAAAAIKCTRFGGISGTPRREEVDALLASQP
jgi:sugar/nucleoside kinase (ribokinase family)